MKKRIALLLAALMLLAITACSAEKPASESPLASQEPAGEVSAEEFTAQPGDQALTIGLSMYTLEEGRAEEIKAMRKSIQYLHDVLDVGVRGR